MALILGIDHRPGSVIYTQSCATKTALAVCMGLDGRPDLTIIGLPDCCNLSRALHQTQRQHIKMGQGSCYPLLQTAVATELDTRCLGRQVPFVHTTIIPSDRFPSSLSTFTASFMVCIYYSRASKSFFPNSLTTESLILIRILLLFNEKFTQAPPLTRPVNNTNQKL